MSVQYEPQPQGQGNPPPAGMYGGNYSPGHPDNGMYEPPPSMQPETQGEATQGTPQKTVPETPPQSTEAPPASQPETYAVDYGGQQVHLTREQMADLAQYGANAYASAQSTPKEGESKAEVPSGVNQDGTPAQQVEKSPYITELESQIAEQSETIKKTQEQLSDFQKQTQLKEYQDSVTRSLAQNETFKEKLKGDEHLENYVRSSIAKAVASNPQTPISEHVKSTVETISGALDTRAQALMTEAADKKNSVPAPVEGGGVAGSEPYKPGPENWENGTLTQRAEAYLDQVQGE